MFKVPQFDWNPQLLFILMVALVTILGWSGAFLTIYHFVFTGEL